ncbi:MAG: C39 family peptidase [Candidatus Riflebacteria bacterium]|nr:C39 family peptidase [Candidatus Riflebacteria bacterium]
MHRWFTLAALFLGLASTAAARSPSPIPTRFLRGVPDVRQMNSSSCGAAAVQAVVCAFFGDAEGEADYWELLGSSMKEGTHPKAIVKGLRKLELGAQMREGMTLAELRHHLDAGRLVILDFQAWGEPAGKDYSKEWEDGHYGVAVGYNDDVVFIEDPSMHGSVGYLSNGELEKRWHDYETEDGRRREYHHLAIVVKGKRRPAPQFRRIE